MPRPPKRAASLSYSAVQWRWICVGSLPSSLGGRAAVDVALERLGRHERVAGADEALVGVDADVQHERRVGQLDGLDRGDLHATGRALRAGAGQPTTASASPAAASVASMSASSCAADRNHVPRAVTRTPRSWSAREERALARAVGGDVVAVVAHRARSEGRVEDRRPALHQQVAAQPRGVLRGGPRSAGRPSARSACRRRSRRRRGSPASRSPRRRSRRSRCRSRHGARPATSAPSAIRRPASAAIGKPLPMALAKTARSGRDAESPPGRRRSRPGSR